MAQQRSDLEGFFTPAGIAIVGSINRSASASALRVQWGERLYLVNKKGGFVEGYPIYESLDQIPHSVELAVIDVAPHHVPDLIEQCGRLGITNVVVFSSGFAEVGPTGAALQRELAEGAKRSKVRVLGPNTNASFLTPIPTTSSVLGGKIGLVTQSGHQGRPLVQGAPFGINFSHWVPTGNEVDLEVSDFIEYFSYDAETAVIAAYLEGFQDGAKLRRALTIAAEFRKPIVVLKIGQTTAGAQMAQAHTGHLAGSDRTVNGLFQQYGVTRVADLDELLETASLFAKLPSHSGARVCAYSMSGGSSALMAEVASQFGVPMPPLSQATQESLHDLIPHYLTTSNPVDNGGRFLISARPEHRRRVLELITLDPSIDLLVVGLTGYEGASTDIFAADLCAFAPISAKPIVVTWNSPKTDVEGFARLCDSGLPIFRSFRNCFKALNAHSVRQRWETTWRPRVASQVRLPTDTVPLLERGPILDARDARTLLQAFGVRFVREVLTTSADEARSAATDLGFPIVMKLSLARHEHGSAEGPVRFNIGSFDEVEWHFGNLIRSASSLDPGVTIDGVLMQEQVPPGVEIILGIISDPILGPAIMVQTGGRTAELLEDVAIRPLPVDALDADEMIRGLRSYMTLLGARDLTNGVHALRDSLLALARLGAALGSRVDELKLSPVFVRPGGVVAVDCQVVLNTRRIKSRTRDRTRLKHNEAGEP